MSQTLYNARKLNKMTTKIKSQIKGALRAISLIRNDVKLILVSLMFVIWGEKGKRLF